MKVGFAERDITPDLPTDRPESPGYGFPLADGVHDRCKVRAAVFLANPAELFAQSGLGIKAGSPFAFTFVVEMANGCVGYTPPEEEFGESGGGLETRLSEYRNLVPSAGRQIVDASRRLAQSMSPGCAPAPVSSAPSRPFAYGTAPPELE